jgi:hypothetical protein
MTRTLTAHVIELAETLHDLRRRFRQAARIEVARAVGEALREVALAMICGPVRFPAPARSADSAWDDPWQDASADPWPAPVGAAREVEADDRHRESPPPLPPALVAALGAARWGFVRTHQVGPAILIGLLVGVAVRAGGPTVKAVVEAWSVADDLLNYTGSNQRP